MHFFISNYGQALALKVACFFMILRNQSSLTIAWEIDQINKF